MNRRPLLLPLGAILLIGWAVSGCKTTESNYRQAYEAAVSQRQEGSGVDSTIYARIRNRATNSSLVVGADSLPLRTESIGATKDGGMTIDSLGRYNVVVGKFKQIFNARQMKQRLIDSGYAGAFILHTREPLYYVCTATSDDPQSIFEAWKRVKADKSVVLRDPLPFILRPAHKAR